MMSVEELRNFIVRTIREAGQAPLETEILPLDDCLGRVLGSDVAAPMDFPSFDVSAMDGYALKGGAEEGASFRVAGRALAGRGFDREPASGETVRIMTGAPLPPGLDAVAMQERVDREGDVVTLKTAVAPGENARLRGEEIVRGETVLRAGRLLGEADVMLLATLGIDRLTVRRKLRLGVLSTGDELVDGGRPLDRAEAIYDSNRHMLLAKCARLPVETVDLGSVPDDPALIRERILERAGELDVLLSTGGVSVGDTDHLKAVVEGIGTVHQREVALKPGKPVVFGRVDRPGPDGPVWYFGLPGNPVSGFVGFDLFVKPAVGTRLDMEAPEPLLFRAALAAPLSKKKGRAEYRRGIYEIADDGSAIVRPLGRQDSHRVLGASRANAYIVLPEEALELEEGAHVLCQPFTDRLP